MTGQSVATRSLPDRPNLDLLHRAVRPACARTLPGPWSARPKTKVIGQTLTSGRQRRGRRSACAEGARQ